MSLAKANDLILGVFSRVPPSPELDHAVRFVSTWSGSDKFFMVRISIMLVRLSLILNYIVAGRECCKTTDSPSRNARPTAVPSGL
jgi:hypothetical protein